MNKKKIKKKVDNSLFFLTGGISIFFPTMNSFVHLLMYSYYGLAALGPQYQKYLWWKKYMTKMQLVSTSVSLMINNLSTIKVYVKLG
jgi:hypothetical protein